MVARVTLAEVDAVRMRMDEAVELYRESVLPALESRAGYEGCYVLTTPEGKALVLTFWETEEAAEIGLATGFYAEQVAKFVTFYAAAPGRETYEVAIARAPATIEATPAP
jgi:heme-degrading monooxygenase HmoA